MRGYAQYFYTLVASTAVLLAIIAVRRIRAHLGITDLGTKFFDGVDSGTYLLTFMVP
jgi:hypothetical protein